MWTDIPKPSAQAYTNLGKPSTLGYTNISKPTGSVIGVLRAGMITGLVIPLTYSTTRSIFGSPWINISKPV